MKKRIYNAAYNKQYCAIFYPILKSQVCKGISKNIKEVKKKDNIEYVENELVVKGVPL